MVSRYSSYSLGLILVIGSIFLWSLIGSTRGQSSDPAVAESKLVAAPAVRRALDYLEVATRQWPSENGCFSCHNNGDAARVLFLAQVQGDRISADSLRSTLDWLSSPRKWQAMDEDAVFKDKKLATIQFAAALAAAHRAGMIREREPLTAAARLLVELQAASGEWSVDAGPFGGSPITYGDALATVQARHILELAAPEKYAAEIARANHWLLTFDPHRVVDLSATLLGIQQLADNVPQVKCRRTIARLLERQHASGGWGPLPGYSPEFFDTAITILALAPYHREPPVHEAVLRARRYLLQHQSDEGTWNETTRPAGGISYAHRVSTSAWATMALIESRRFDGS